MTDRSNLGNITHCLKARETGVSASLAECAYALPSAAVSLRHLGILQYNPPAIVNAPALHPAFALRFKPHSSVLAVCDEGGNIAIIQTADELRTLQISKAHLNAVFDLAWNVSGSVLATAAADHLVRIFDPESLTSILELKGHSGTVKSTRFARTSEYTLASTGRDGNAYVWDTRSPDKPVMEFRKAHTAQAVTASSSSSVPTAAFTPDDRVLVTGGAADGCVKLWDTRKLIMVKKSGESSPLHSFSNNERSKGGVSSIDISSRDGTILALRTDGVITLYSGLGIEGYERQLSRGASTTYFVRATFACDGRLVVSGSCSREILLWDLHTHQHDPIRDSQHFGEVSGVSSVDLGDQSLIASCGDDALVSVWNIDQ